MRAPCGHPMPLAWQDLRYWQQTLPTEAMAPGPPALPSSDLQQARRTSRHQACPGRKQEKQPRRPLRRQRCCCQLEKPERHLQVMPPAPSVEDPNRRQEGVEALHRSCWRGLAHDGAEPALHGQHRCRYCDPSTHPASRGEQHAGDGPGSWERCPARCPRYCPRFQQVGRARR